MKKSLLALAVLGAFTGAAVAQSSVTIYGSVDQAVTKGNGGGARNVGANGTSEAYILKNSNQSRLGFRGNEDMGGGLSAQFQLEHRFNADDGTNQNPFWTGRSYVQVTHAAAGSVYLGRDYAPAFWIQVKSDPFGNDGVAQFGTAMSWAGFSTNTGAARLSNTVGYKSPSFGGLRVQVATGLGEGAVSREDGFNIEYGAGPIYAGFAFERLRGGPAATDGNKLMNFALHYDLGFVKPIFYYSRAELGVNDQFTNDYWFIGALAPIGPGRLKAGYGVLQDELTGGGTEIENSKLGIGYDYPLSKRTNLYLDASWAKEDNQSNNRIWAFGVKHTF